MSETAKTEPPLPAGVYEHWKGGHYFVLGVGRYEPTEEEVVVYVRLYERSGIPLSVRPLTEFLSDVVDDHGVQRARFRYLGNAE